MAATLSKTSWRALACAAVAAQAAKLGKPMVEVAGSKMAAPFNTLSAMILDNSSDDGGEQGNGNGGSKSIVNQFKGMFAKKDKAA